MHGNVLVHIRDCSSGPQQRWLPRTRQGQGHGHALHACDQINLGRAAEAPGFARGPDEFATGGGPSCSSLGLRFPTCT
eukprot:6525440-Lingulodinium_polyedra.AAC.1